MAVDTVQVEWGQHRSGAAIESPRMSTVDRIAAWMRRQMVAAGAHGFVVGISGGIDSAVVSRLAQLAAPGHVFAVIMPSHSDPQDERDAILVANHFSLPAIRVDLSSTFDSLASVVRAALAALPSQPLPQPLDPLRGQMPLANMNPRLRMTALYFFANSLGYLVAGTGNRSELSIGYFTKYGDGGCDLLPLGRLTKNDVRDLARDLHVPQAVIDRAPTAGLWPSQTDEAEMGFTYRDLEHYLDDGAQGVPPALAMRIERLMRSSEHKRQMPPMPDD